MPFPRFWEFFEKWMITDRCENVLDAETPSYIWKKGSYQKSMGSCFNDLGTMRSWGKFKHQINESWNIFKYIIFVEKSLCVHIDILKQTIHYLLWIILEHLLVIKISGNKGKDEIPCHFQTSYSLRQANSWTGTFFFIKACLITN